MTLIPLRMNPRPSMPVARQLSTSRRQKQVLSSSAWTRFADLLTSKVVLDGAGPERWIQLSFTWASKTFTLDIAESDRVFDLKAALQSLTDVPPERQKILGLVKGKLPPDQERV